MGLARRSEPHLFFDANVECGDMSPLSKARTCPRTPTTDPNWVSGARGLALDFCRPFSPVKELSHNCHLTRIEMSPFTSGLKRARDISIWLTAFSGIPATGLLKRANQQKQPNSMRLRKLAAITTMALAATVMITPSVRAQVIYNSDNGDFLIGFRQEGNTNSVLADIGPIADLTVSHTFPLGDLATKMSNAFGPNWATDATVWFSLAATNRPGDVSRTNYVTYSDQIRQTPWNRLTSGNSLALQNKVIAMGNQYNQFSSQQTAGPAVIEPQAQAPDGYREYMPGGTNDAGHAQGNISFGFFNPDDEGNFGGGVANTPLHLVQLVPTPPTGPGTVVGTFTLNSDGSTLTFTPPMPLQVTGAVSRKTHGAAGTFDINLPLTGTDGVECRTTGGTNDHTMVVTFSGNVTVTGSPQAQVTSGTGCVGSGGVCDGNVSVSGNVVTVPLTTIGDQQNINVRINGVNGAGSDAPATDFNIPMGVLAGDTNANRTVNAADVSQTKGQSGQPVTAANFRNDVNANGTINAGDINIVKANSGHSIP